MTALAALTLYAHEPATLATFWSAVLDLSMDPDDKKAIAAGTLAPNEAVLLGPRHDFHIWISPADKMPPAHGRIHFEVQLGGSTNAELLLHLGATHERDDPEGRWTVYADPEGNRFCAMPASPPQRSFGGSTGAPAARAEETEAARADAGEEESPCTR